MTHSTDKGVVNSPQPTVPVYDDVYVRREFLLGKPPSTVVWKAEKNLDFRCKRAHRSSSDQEKPFQHSPMCMADLCGILVESRYYRNGNAFFAESGMKLFSRSRSRRVCKRVIGEFFSRENVVVGIAIHTKFEDSELMAIFGKLSPTRRRCWVEI
mgnify:CR=1 FL=1